MKIIYRAFDKDTKEMYKHIDEIHFLLGGDVIRANSVISEIEEHRMVNSYSDLDDGFVLLQYIGLKDKNKQWLFEGDICIATLPCNGDEYHFFEKTKQVLAKIVYSEDHAGYMFEYNIYKPTEYDQDRHLSYSSSKIHINSKMMAECEVVGNIYQSDMELLNKTFAREFKINSILK